MLAILGDVLLSNIEQLKNPYKLHLVVTKECNSKCKYCKIWKQTPDQELTLSEYEKISKNVSSVKWLNITGGEPTLREDLPEIVKIFKRNCKNFDYLNYSTNGILPDQVEKVSKKIAELKIKKFFINVSLDGPPELHDSLRGVQGNFYTTLETFKRLKKISQIETSFAFTFYGPNNDKLFETIKAVQSELIDISADDFHLNLPQTSSHHYMNASTKMNFDEKALFSIQEFNKMKKYNFSPISIIEKNYRENALKIINEKNIDFGCSAIQSSVYISEKGEVFPCTVWGKPLGSLRENEYNLSRILYKPTTKKIRQDVKTRNCPKCWSPCEAFQSMAANLKKIRI